MAQRVLVQLVDDLDGSAGPSVQTIKFGLEGTSYEVDLSSKNANKLRNALADFVTVARATEKPRAKKKVNGTDSKAIRQWAMDNGIEVPATGRVPKAVQEQYAAAH